MFYILYILYSLVLLINKSTVGKFPPVFLQKMRGMSTMTRCVCYRPWGRAVGARLTDAARPTTSCRATTMTGPATSTRGVTGCGGAGRCERSKRWRNGWAATVFHIYGSPHWCDPEWVRCMGNPLEAYVSSATLSIGDPFWMYGSSLKIAWTTIQSLTLFMWYCFATMHT
jgi:hypothetical protein